MQAWVLLPMASPHREPAALCGASLNVEALVLLPMASFHREVLLPMASPSKLALSGLIS